MESWNSGIVGKSKDQRESFQCLVFGFPIIQYSIFDESVKSRKGLMIVIPAKAGIQ